MKSRWLLIVLWTVVLGVPFTALSLATVALIDKATAVLMPLSAGHLAKTGLEGSARWPELAGMVIGQAVILLILLLVRRSDRRSHLAALARRDSGMERQGSAPGLCRFASLRCQSQQTAADLIESLSGGGPKGLFRKPSPASLGTKRIHPSGVDPERSFGFEAVSGIRRAPLPPPNADWMITPSTNRPTSTEQVRRRR